MSLFLLFEAFCFCFFFFLFFVDESKSIPSSFSIFGSTFLVTSILSTLFSFLITSILFSFIFISFVISFFAIFVSSNLDSVSSAEFVEENSTLDEISLNFEEDLMCKISLVASLELGSLS